MAGVPAGLPAGVRLSDHISLGVIARAFPPDRVRQILTETGKASERERDLPAHLPAQVMVYYAIALALYMGSGTRELLRHRPGALHGQRHPRATTPSPWRSTWAAAPARSCAASWRACAGSGVP